MLHVLDRQVSRRDLEAAVAEALARAHGEARPDFLSRVDARACVDALCSYGVAVHEMGVVAKAV